MARTRTPSPSFSESCHAISPCLIFRCTFVCALIDWIDMEPATRDTQRDQLKPFRQGLRFASTSGVWANTAIACLHDSCKDLPFLRLRRLIIMASSPVECSHGSCKSLTLGPHVTLSYSAYFCIIAALQPGMHSTCIGTCKRQPWLAIRSEKQELVCVLLSV